MSNKHLKGFYYHASASVSDIDALFVKNSNQFFSKSYNLFITRARPKGYKAYMKNPLFSKGASSWFAKVFVEIAKAPDKSQSYLKFTYSQTLFFKLTIGKIYFYAGILLIGLLTLLRFGISDLGIIESFLGILLVFITIVTFYHYITKWGKEEQQSEIRMQVIQLLKSQDVSLKRIQNM